MALEFVSNVFQVNSSVYCEDLMEVSSQPKFNYSFLENYLSKVNFSSHAFPFLVWVQYLLEVTFSFCAEMCYCRG